MTQAKLAAKAGVKQQMISKIENGKADTTGDIVSLATALDVTAEYLQYGRQPRDYLDGEVIYPAISEPPIPPLPDQRSTLSPRERALLDHFNGLTDAQQEAFFRQIQDQKHLNDELLVQLMARRQAKS